VAEKTLKMIRIKWVRSGIGLTYHQKTIVRSLGLYKMNRTVVRPDTPQIRGIVAAVPHMLQVVPEPVPSAWASIPEYTVYAPVASPAEAVPAATTEVAGDAVAPADITEEPAAGVKAKSPKAKSASAGKKKKSSPKESEPA
jgi:large subunit ribosomal protein L30